VWNKGAYDLEEGYITATLEEAYMCVLAGSNCAQFKGSGAISTLESLRKQRTDILVEIDRIERLPEEDADDKDAKAAAI